MTTYHWADQRERATRLFNGEVPITPALEQTIIDVFTTNPVLVAQAIDRIGHVYQAGKITSGWAVLKTEIERAHAESPTRDILATDNAARAKKTKQAEQWLRTAGLHYDRETEIQDELFDGILKPWKDDQPLRDKMTTLWRQLRPTGQQLETEEVERANEWKRSHTCERCGRIRPFLMRPCPNPRCVPPAALEPATAPDSFDAT